MNETFCINEPDPVSNHTWEEYCQWYPEDRPKPPEGTFEIALVLAGAVSAGAYSAGVLDTLTEALDRWTRAREQGFRDERGALAPADIPRHEVRIKVVTGASAGGMCAAIWAGASRFKFESIDEQNALFQGPRHPLYNAWVNQIDMSKLLDTGDLKNGRVVSLLNSQSLLDIAASAIGCDGQVADPRERQWLADPLPVVLTLANLQGVPFGIRFKGQTGLAHEVILHGDQIAFEVPVFSECIRKLCAPDSLCLPLAREMSDLGWKSFAQAALATGAFPGALVPREIWRAPTDYEYRYCARNPRGEMIHAKPWPAGATNPERFLCVDGGSMNNEPFDLAHAYLAGGRGENPRDGAHACRAVLMINPFADARAQAPPLDSMLSATLVQLLTAFKEQCRFKPLDLDLAADEEVYSRFLIAPKRYPYVGSMALCSGALGAFFGFFSRAYRHHDYMLGRANCQAFLRRSFCLPEEGAGGVVNPLFTAGRWTAAAKERFSTTEDGKRYLQIIPIFEREELKPAPWPADAFKGYEEFARPIEARLEALADCLQELLPGQNRAGWLSKWLKGLYLKPIRNRILSSAKEAIKTRVDQAAREIHQRQFSSKLVTPRTIR